MVWVLPSSRPDGTNTLKVLELKTYIFSKITFIHNRINKYQIKLKDLKYHIVIKIVPSRRPMSRVLTIYLFEYRLDETNNLKLLKPNT
ncbi:hypothetical protein ACFOG5_18475 [Pedobacter fastidiosus]|uniref:hypothetical protein n=1 Tax=Pedobacter fastidiosus TaxID=2765361 RepID=UPI00361EDBD4